MTKTRRLRELLETGEFLYMPAATTPLEGRLCETAGVKVVYTGGYATGATCAISEPLLTLSEQLAVAGAVARAVAVPLIADAGAGFGEPLHTMRTVREFAAAGIAGIHIEDQLFPKRAHYHKYTAHALPRAEFVDKIRWACHQRDEIDRDFVIIARTDTCREFGLDEAIARINAAAEVGADLGLLFPRNDEEAAAAPRRAGLPLVWVQSRGNRACIDAQLLLGAAVFAVKEALAEMLGSGRYTGIDAARFTLLRKEIEDLIGLESFYRVEAETVEKPHAG